MTQITQKVQIDSKELIQLLIDNGYLDEYFTNADVNTVIASQVNNNDKVVQFEVGLNIGLDYLKQIEDIAQEQFEEVCGCENSSECPNDTYSYDNEYNNVKGGIPLIGFINEFAKAMEKYERGI